MVLAMDMHQPSAELTQQLNAHRGVVDEGARPSAGIQLSAQDGTLIEGDLMNLEPRTHVRPQNVHLQFHHAALLRVARSTRLSTLAHGQSQRTDQYALATSRFPGDDRQAFAERKVHFLDQEVIADVKAAQHD